MARFVFTMTVPTFKGNLVQQVIGEYKASSLTEIYQHITRGQKWFLVMRLYQESGPQGKIWKDRAEILVNADWCGMITEFVERNDDY